MDQEASESLDDLIEKEFQKCQDMMDFIEQPVSKVNYLKRCVKDEIKQRIKKTEEKKKLKKELQKTTAECVSYAF